MRLSGGIDVKKCLLLAGLMLLLTGCGSQETFEMVTDDYVQPVMAQMQQIVVSLPVDASVEVLESDTQGTIYLCDGYTVTVHTTEAGDLAKTLYTATGFSEEDLQTIQTQYGSVSRTDSVWTAAGETEEQVGRIAVLDDGSYHYVLTCMTDASKMEQLQPVWGELFDSFRLVSAQMDLNTGS